jgi:hypothetical protein
MSVTKHTNHVSFMNTKTTLIMPKSFKVDLADTACIAVFRDID